MLSDGQLHVVMCGTGSPLADANRASACVAVVAGSEVILIDTGPGSWPQVALNKLAAQNLSAILFRLDYRGRSVVVSGDTTKSANIDALHFYTLHTRMP